MKNLITISAAFLLFANSAFAQSVVSKSTVSVSNQSLGQEQLNKKNYKEAVKYFTACVEEGDPLGECRVGRGKAYLGLDEEGYATANFAIALKTNPKNKEAAELLAKYKNKNDAPKITSEGIKQYQKLSAEDKKKANDVIKAQEKVYNSGK
ncbi:hypothetical protein [Halpernia sp.]|uniref:hypothetical protein n=1 Tax=Halpernia sp. TaxID=2782209 RepID=UPI003A94C0C3